MKAFFSAIVLFGLLCFGTPAAHSQYYPPYYGSIWDPQYQQYLNYQNYQQWQLYLNQLQRSDPYYQLIKYITSCASDLTIPFDTIQPAVMV